MTCVRSLLIGLFAAGVAFHLRALLSAPQPARRRLAWLLLLAPYLTPALLIGHAYGSFSLSLLHYPRLNAVFYAVLLGLKLTPVAAVALYFTPGLLTPAALHCHRLAHGYGRLQELYFRARAGCFRAPLAAVVLVFLLAFGEFELAALMNLQTWTVSVFDAHAGGLTLAESLRHMLVPLSVQAGALLLGVILLFRLRIAPTPPAVSPRWPCWPGWTYLGLAFVIVCVIPAAVMLHGTVQGVGVLLENFALKQELAASLLFAALGAAAALILARWRVTASLALPGLLGPLVLALFVLAGEQLVPQLRETPLPLALTLGLVLLPAAVLLRLVIRAAQPGAPLHLASLLGDSRAARELMWRLRTRARFGAAVLLFLWAYWDLTASAILAPIGMTPVTVRLYNLMHYGQTAVLSAMLAAALAAPLLVLGAALFTRNWWAR